MDSRFLDLSSKKNVTRSGSGSRSEITSPADGNSIYERARLLESSTSNHYQHLSELPADEVLIYIDKMLMEEDNLEDDDDTIHALQESSDFREKERSFYEVLGQNYPPSPPPQQQESTSLTEGQIATMNFWKGVAEAAKFLPSNTSGFTEDGSVRDPKEGPSHLQTSLFRQKKEDAIEELIKKNDFITSIAEEFDTWTCTYGGGCDHVFEAHITDLRNAVASDNSSSSRPQQNIGPHKRRSGIKEEADLRSLLILCAQSVSEDDHPAANDLLKQIRTHSSIEGNVDQRVAHYFALGLEARLAGTSGMNLVNMDTISPSDYFLAYCTSFISTSSRKISIFASSKLIAEKSKKSSRVHIVDLGILYGLQWPAFIQRLGQREGGPPKLRITGIDHPQPNSDPSERIADTGARLAHYAKLFGVPFEYNGIVKSWESIKVEDLKIEKGEFVAVNCLYRAENLRDEMMNGAECPREKVVHLIRKMNPDVFVHAVVSAGYGSPYFITRFREALFHFSAVFDSLEIVLPREGPGRMVMQSILGSEIVNVIACEGAERVSRPEKHRQWELRYTRAGFKQLSFGRKLVGAIQNKVRTSYHKELITSEDHKWLLLSWKGRTICGISCWQSV